MATKSDPAYCPKSDEGVKSAVKSGAVVVGLGKAAAPVADLFRQTLGKHRVPTLNDNWEETKVNHLIVIVECSPMNGDCCDAAAKFCRQVRASDGYGVYSDIIQRQVAVLALGKMGKVSGATKVEDVLIKRGGCQKLVAKIGRADVGVKDANKITFIKEVADALDAMYGPPPADEKDLAPQAAPQPTPQPAPQPKPQPTPQPAPQQAPQPAPPPQAPSPPPQAPSPPAASSPASATGGRMATIAAVAVAAAIVVALVRARK